MLSKHGKEMRMVNIDAHGLGKKSHGLHLVLVEIVQDSITWLVKKGGNTLGPITARRNQAGIKTIVLNPAKYSTMQHRGLDRNGVLVQ